MSDVPEGHAAISVARDGGSAWVCTVEWPNGRRVTHERVFHLGGWPTICVTTEERALECLEQWVRQRPEDWR